MRALVIPFCALALAAGGYAAAQDDHSAHQSTPPSAKAAPGAPDAHAGDHKMPAHCMAMMHAKAGDTAKGHAATPSPKAGDPHAGHDAKAADAPAMQCMEMMKAMMQEKHAPAAPK